MKKNNNKGFVLLETLVVSSFIITILIYLYVQFVSLKNSYDTSFRYDSIPNLYSLKQVDTFINKAYGYETLKSELAKSENNNYLELYKNKCDLEYFSNNNSYCNKLMENLNIKTLLIINNNLASIKTRFKEHNPYSNGLYKYLKTIDPVLASKSYLLIAEFNDKSYAYLRVDDVNVVVTFDANGGSVKTRTKNVTPGNTYGELPTPTREGYTFKGWNGKNKLNLEEWLNSFSEATRGTISKTNNSVTITATSNDAYTQTYGNACNTHCHKINIDPVKYTLSWKSNNRSVNGHIFAFVNNKETTGYMKYADQMNATSLTIDSPEDSKYLVFRVGVATSGDSITYSDIMIEEGEEATEYEPYYVTKDTKVVQSSNHTLKAIWEANN